MVGDLQNRSSTDVSDGGRHATALKNETDTSLTIEPVMEEGSTTNVMLCCVCGDTAGTSLYSCCSSGHSMCEDCAEGHVENLLGTSEVVNQSERAGQANDNRPQEWLQFVADGAKVRCPAVFDVLRHGQVSQCEANIEISELRGCLSETTFANLHAACIEAAKKTGSAEERNRLTSKFPTLAQRILEDQLRDLMPSAFECPKCGFGPIQHKNCSDLSAHHGEGGTDNSCPRCLFFSNDISAYRRWSGKLPDAADETVDQEWASLRVRVKDTKWRTLRLVRRMNRVGSKLFMYTISAVCHSLEKVEDTFSRTYIPLPERILSIEVPLPVTLIAVVSLKIIATNFFGWISFLMSTSMSMISFLMRVSMAGFVGFLRVLYYTINFMVPIAWALFEGCVKTAARANGSIEMMLQFEGVWGLITKFVLLTLAVLLVWCQFGQSYLNQLLQKQERKLRSTSSIITGKYLWFVPGWFICTLLLDVDWVLVIGKLSQSKHWSAVWKDGKQACHCLFNYTYSKWIWALNIALVGLAWFCVQDFQVARIDTIGWIWLLFLPFTVIRCATLSKYDGEQSFRTMSDPNFAGVAFRNSMNFADRTASSYQSNRTTVKGQLSNGWIVVTGGTNGPKYLPLFADKSEARRTFDSWFLSQRRNRGQRTTFLEVVKLVLRPWSFVPLLFFKADFSNANADPFFVTTIERISGHVQAVLVAHLWCNFSGVSTHFGLIGTSVIAFFLCSQMRDFVREMLMTLVLYSLNLRLKLPLRTMLVGVSVICCYWSRTMLTGQQ